MDMGKIPARAQVKLLLNPNGAADSTPASGTKSAPPWVNGLTNYPSPDAAEQPFGKTPLRSNIKPGRSASNAAMLERAGICSLLRQVSSRCDNATVNPPADCAKSGARA